MGFKIVWTDRAIEELREICRYLAEQSPSAAEKVGNDIIRHVDILSSFPLIGPPYPRGGSDDVREVRCRRYRVFYRVRESELVAQVLTIWHAARGAPPFDIV